MRRVCINESELPRNWGDSFKAGKSLLLERDVRIGRSLYLKLLVFDSTKAMIRFWNRTPATNIYGKLDSDAVGVVAPLSFDWVETPEGEDAPILVDRRYFSAMGLSQDRLGSRVITHESVHAAFNYARRLGPRCAWYKITGGDYQERVCYPAGEIAMSVVNALYASGLLV